VEDMKKALDLSWCSGSQEKRRLYVVPDRSSLGEQPDLPSEQMSYAGLESNETRIGPQ
jgi:hypothetical protein